ncbi:septal ring lytic transglycosylase RlpA family protein [Rufibacter latericius]|uniref:Probable endolytic peptidoglycan transglycosylase RlpA n=1 Tax=Rufibacter latericius TaxID=2487040 RepID=A0A3M9MDH4_9BACT|nr:septal ring lytic transglycosylase RlpA family protein [Rufibacter latericius]RNI23596.1 septal ring lytic transglycosylase RlpA family protein [Rufibacter latericius]
MHKSPSWFRWNLLCLLFLVFFFSSCSSSEPAFGKRGYTENGKASFYSDKLKGNKMANGEPYRPGKRTAAHKKLPFGTKVKVINPQNGRSVKVLITDRGPFARGRIIDLSKSAARKLDLEKSGVAPVQMKVLREGRR